MLTVNEIFRSIQGESTWAGHPCVFVRLSGCNLRCTYCDTRYAYDVGESMSVGQIVEKVGCLGPGIAEVTGGEPLLQEEAPALLAALAATGRTVLIETNGTLPLPGRRPYHVIMDIKCPSSGEEQRTCWANVRALTPGDEVKLVVADRADFDWAAERVTEHCLGERGLAVLVSPVAGELDPRDLARWVLDSRLPLRLQLQLHRVIWPECDRGV